MNPTKQSGRMPQRSSVRSPSLVNRHVQRPIAFEKNAETAPPVDSLQTGLGKGAVKTQESKLPAGN
jgi:hypothetical protein